MEDVKKLIISLRSVLPRTADGSQSWCELAADALESLQAKVEEQEAEIFRLHEKHSKGFYTPSLESDRRRLKAENEKLRAELEEKQKRLEVFAQIAKNAYLNPPSDEELNKEAERLIAEGMKEREKK